MRRRVRESNPGRRGGRRALIQQQQPQPNETPSMGHESGSQRWEASAYPTKTTSTHMRRRVWVSNPGRRGGRRTLIHCANHAPHVLIQFITSKCCNNKWNSSNVEKLHLAKQALFESNEKLKEKELREMFNRLERCHSEGNYGEALRVINEEEMSRRSNPSQWRLCSRKNNILVQPL